MSAWRVAMRKAATDAVQAAVGDEVGVYNGFPPTGLNYEDAPFVIVTVPSDSVPDVGTMRGALPVDVALAFECYSPDGEDGAEALLAKVHEAMTADDALGGAAQGVVYVGYEAEDPQIEGETPVYIGVANYLGRARG